MSTLLAALDHAAARSPDATAHFHSHGERLTYPHLAAAARALAHDLHRGGREPGEAVGILSPNAPEFLTAFFGAAGAGLQACPLALPLGRRGSAAFVHRLRHIVAASGMRTILLSHRLEQFAPLLAPLVGLTVLTPPGAAPSPGPGSDPVAGTAPRVDPTDTVLTQFTSGSTADPKGVRLSHANILAGLASIRRGIALADTDSGGFWIPLFHDMGLFGTLSAIFAGIDVHLWEPAAFARRPGTWLREFLDTGATITAMPDSGYGQLVSAVDRYQAADLDMRHWRLAMNGAEPVSRTTVHRFTDHFAAAGFRPEAMFPVYGMAEAVLAVTFPPLGRRPVFDRVDRERLADERTVVPVPPDDPGGRDVAGLGHPVEGLDLRVDAPDGEVGEIQIRGGAVTRGYLAQAGEAFTTDGWLRTGDLGYRRDAEVFVTGRIKEMITVHGRNFYPQDVETLARDVPGVSRGRCVAVADTEREQILLIAESSLAGEPAAALETDLRRRISAVLDLAAVRVRLVAPHSLPRTSSGKYQRDRARDLVRSEG